MRAGSTNSILLAVTAVLGVSAGYAVRTIQEKSAEKPAVYELEKTIDESYAVSRVVDGDTVDVEQGIEVLLYRIRLLGINARDRGEPGYNDAKEKLKELIAGREVFLERDKDNTDRYGRALRYIIVGSKNLNIELVRLGYAKVYMHKGLRYERQLLEAEQEARQNKRGIWADNK